MEDEKEHLRKVSGDEEPSGSPDGDGELAIALSYNAPVEGETRKTADEECCGVKKVCDKVQHFRQVRLIVGQNVLNVFDVPSRAEMDENDAQSHEGDVDGLQFSSAPVVDHFMFLVPCPMNAYAGRMFTGRHATVRRASPSSTPKPFTMTVRV